MNVLQQEVKEAREQGFPLLIIDVEGDGLIAIQLTDDDVEEAIELSNLSNSLFMVEGFIFVESLTGSDHVIAEFGYRDGIFVAVDRRNDEEITGEQAVRVLPFLGDFKLLPYADETANNDVVIQDDLPDWLQDKRSPCQSCGTCFSKS